ncbi:MAG: extracellular solute-binding protein [Clostridia bacterium]|nr:extracellular solute-binding protein [Clostridia bacterium]
MNRRFGILFLALMLAVSLLGVPAAATEDITLRVAWWGSQTRHDNTLAAIDLYMERNPHVKIDAQFLAWDGYWEMMAAAIAGNNVADVFQQDYQYLKLYAENGIMYNLNEFLADGTIDTEFIDENSILGGAVDGDVYAISLGLNSQCVAWNPALFEEAGVEPPDDMWTWADYIETATALSEALGIYGDETFPVSYFHGPNLWMRQNGYSFYAQDGTSALGYPDDQLLADYYQMDLDLASVGAVTSADIRDELSVTSIEQVRFVTAEAAMFSGLGGSNQLAAMVNAAGVPFKLAALPHVEEETSGQFLKPSQYFSIYSGTPYPEEAAKFLDFITNDIDANLCLKGERGVPISSKIREALEPTLDETQREIYRYISAVAEFAWPIGQPEPPQHAEIDAILKNVQIEMLSGGVTPLEAAQKVRSESERIFAED